MKNILYICLFVFVFFSLEAKEHKSKRKAKSSTSSESVWEKELREKIAKKDPPSWMVERIQKDCAPFAEAKITKVMLDENMAESARRGNNCHFVRYKISNNQLEILENNTKKYGDEGSRVREAAVTSSLNSLLKNASLSDCEFIITMHDHFDEKVFSAPVLTFAKSTTKGGKGILIPDFEALSYEYGKNFLDKIEETKTLYVWKNKENIAIWRGACTGKGKGGEEHYSRENFLQFPRSLLVSLSLRAPEEIDARFTTLDWFSEDFKKQWGSYFSSSLSMQDHLKYKYQILIDGNSCAYSRGYWEFFSRCLTFKEESDNIQWYYGALEPYVHYVSFTLEDLVDKIDWARKNDVKAYQIAQNARSFSEENLSYSSILYYFYLVLGEYSKLQG